ncbi:MAG: transcriptional repressor [Elusimicrobiota bacterium]|nr:transcriptional repressor [Elusimicrobiota bacterium]
MQRDTSQRRAIRRALDDAGRPLGALEVLEASKDFAPGLGIATVYRNIKALLKEGEISEVALPGEPPRYEAAGKDHHHHFRCERCEKVYELGGACLSDLKNALPRGFRVTSHEVLVHGVCAACAHRK